MPVQMVCDSTSLVSAALRDSLTSSGSNGNSSSGLGGGNSMSAASSSSYGRAPATSSYFGVSSSGNSSGFVDSDDEDLVGRFENQMSDALRRKQLKPIRYEEVSNYSSEQDNFKSKYIVLKAPASASASNGINGSASIGGGAGTINGSTNTHLTNGGGRGNPPSTVTSKLSATSATCNGISQQNGSSSSSPAVGKDQLPAAKRVLYPRENVQIGWKATGRKWTTGAGFTNVGNTCYLNSTLQALFHVPAIANWLISDSSHRERCDDSGNGQGCIICAMAKTLLASQSNQGSIKPYMVVSKLRLVCKHLVPGRQEDAHEFLRYLVEAMEKCYLSRFKNSKEYDQYTKETTPLNQILGGYLRSEVKCLNCQHVSTTFQHFEDLLLDIRKVNSIEEALGTYFGRERLEDMQYKCEACKKKVSATKQFSLERAPFALCIQLKRFSMMGGKINKHVELKTRLDLTPYSSKSAGSSGKLTYKLVSMVTHLGSTQHCGHYTAIGGTETGTYYVFDDSLVRPISLQNVTSTNAYIIFYELESVQNGIKHSASSTATSASFPNAYGSSPAGKYGSSFDGGSNPGGASSHSTPLRVHGPSGNAGHNPLIPSKLENRPNFIGPMLPQQTQEKTKKLANGLSHLYDEDEGEAIVSSSSPRVSPISSTTSSMSSPSPVKQPCPNGASSSGGKIARNAPNSPMPNAKSKFGNGMANPASSNSSSSNSNNGTFKSSSSSAASPSTYSLPSMPKLCNSPAAAKNFSGENGDASVALASSAGGKGAGFPGLSKTNGAAVPNGHHNGNKSVSLVPYDADDDDDDDDDEEEDDAQKRSGGGGGKKRNGGRNPAEEDDDDDSDEDVDRIQSHVLLGPVNNGHRQQQRPSHPVEEEYSPKSPPVIKSKTGPWKVSDNRPSSSSSSSANSSNNTSPATSGNSSPANYGHMNGNGGSGGPLASGYQPNNRQYNNGFNGYNGSNNRNGNGNGNDIVNQLRQFSHRGYGAPTLSWNGQQTNMERELSNERREDRKRQFEDDCDTEMDRGRTKKVKTHFYHQTQRQQQQQQQHQQQNPFQMHQMMNGGNGGNNNNNNLNRKWNNNNQFGGKFFHNRGGNYYQNGNHPRNHNGFRNGRHGRNGYYNKSHYHHQRDKF